MNTHVFPIVFTIECRVVINIWRRGPISFKRVSLWCLLFGPYRTTYQSNLGAQLKKWATLRPIYLEDERIILIRLHFLIIWKLWIGDKDCTCKRSCAIKETHASLGDKLLIEHTLRKKIDEYHEAQWASYQRPYERLSKSTRPATSMGWNLSL